MEPSYIFSWKIFGNPLNGSWAKHFLKKTYKQHDTNDYKFSCRIKRFILFLNFDISVSNNFSFPKIHDFIKIINRLTTTRFSQDNELFYKQLRSGASPVFCRNCICSLYFRNFQSSKLLKRCLIVWPNKHILRVFQWFFRICHWYTACVPLIKDQSRFYVN